MKPVVIVASGPSLSDEQCDLIDAAYLGPAVGAFDSVEVLEEALRKPTEIEWEGITTIAVNDCYRRLAADTIDYVYAADALWWRTYHKDVKKLWFNSVMLSADRSTESLGVRFVPTKIGQGLSPEGEHRIHRHHSSAHQAVEYAVKKLKAKKIILVGVDCKADAEGKKHWFGDHPKQFRSPQPFDLWIEDWNMIEVSARERNIEIVNCSLDTAVTCFRRADLKEELSRCNSESP